MERKNIMCEAEIKEAARYLRYCAKTKNQEIEKIIKNYCGKFEAYKDFEERLKEEIENINNKK